MSADPIFTDGHYARHQAELEAVEDRRKRADQRFCELLASNFDEVMVDHWKPQWGAKLCDLVRKYPDEDFSKVVIAVLKQVADKEAE